MEMSIYNISLELLSPTVITKRRTPTGFLGVSDHIPASTLRGAIITSLYWKGIINEDNVEKESKNPTIIASPAYPLVGKKRKFPASPFIYKCKKCEADNDKDSLVIKVKEARKKILEGEEPDIDVECEKHHRALKSLHYKPVLLTKEEARGPSSLRVICVGISRATASSMKGMLYSYEALAPESRFWATVALPSDIDLRGVKEIFIGRGRSRGMGWARLNVEEKISLENEADKLKDCLKSEWLALYSLSPVILTKNHYLDLTSIGSLLNVEIKEPLEMIDLYGRNIKLSLGWDLHEARPRPNIEAKAPGTVVRARMVFKDLEEASLAIAALKYLGTAHSFDDTMITGVNFFMLFEGEELGFV